MNKRGFTLIELMIVVLVIGILAAVGIPKYQNFVMESRQKSCMSQLKSVDQSLQVWETKNVAFPYDDYFDFHFRPGGETDLWGHWKCTQPGTGNGYWVGPAADVPPNGSDQIQRILNDQRAFVCPEVVTNYGGAQAVPDTWPVNYRFFKLSPAAGWAYDWVPWRVRRATTCFAYGYNWNDNVVTGAWWGWYGPVNNIAPGWAGPDHTRATMHLQFVGRN